MSRKYPYAPRDPRRQWCSRGTRSVHVAHRSMGRERTSPRLEHSATSDTNVLRVKMSQRHTFVVSAETFAWLSRRHELR